MVIVVIVRLLSRSRLFAIPWTAACQASLSSVSSRSLPTFLLIEFCCCSVAQLCLTLWWCYLTISYSGSVQFSSVAQSCPILCDSMNRSTPGLPVHHQLPEFTQTHVHWVNDVMKPSHPLSSPSPPTPNPSQHQSLFQWVNSSHEVAKVLEFQL